ncbi:MAG: sugar transferase [Luteolibacter sp.]
MSSTPIVMINTRERGLFQLLITTQIFLISLLYGVCFLGVLGAYHRQLVYFDAYGRYGATVLGAMILESISRPQSLRPGMGRMKWLAGAVTRRQWIWILSSISLLLVFSQDIRISRAFLAVFSLLSLAVFYVTNRYLLLLLGSLGLNYVRNWRLKTFILGPKEWCDSIMPEVHQLDNLLEIRNVEPTDDPSKTKEDYLDMLARESFDLLVMPARHLPDEMVISLMRQGDKLGYRCWMPVELSRRYGRRFDLQKVGGFDILTPPMEPLTNTCNQIMKRSFDIAFSLPLVLTVIPVLSLFVWAVHRKQSPGPLFFKQNRVGRNGEIFKVFKFRTLHADHGTEARQVTKDDNRVFSGGALMRKLSIDEIPQFINVLLGDMSVVGPRPHMAEHDFKFREIFERYGVRRYVKPGVTGLAQVKGFRGEVNRPRDLRHRARLDNFYVGHWELGLDVQIVIKTGLTMIIPPKTAY